MLTIRELARGQGFPDHFKFYSAPELHRSSAQVTTVRYTGYTIVQRLTKIVPQIHKQMGNAVAWPVGRALGRELKEALFKQWLSTQTGEDVESLLEPWYWYADGELVVRGINDH